MFFEGNGNNDMDVGGSTTHNRHQVSIDPGTYFVTRILLKALIVGLAILIGTGAYKLWQWCRSKAKKQAETEEEKSEDQTGNVQVYIDDDDDDDNEDDDDDDDDDDDVTTDDVTADDVMLVPRQSSAGHAQRQELQPLA
ncbi:PREDICTED: calsequestrin-2-like isoform X1 [Branchiostoma belcheri]|uniref:Calsequestrin-2-like isoform X1 n=1 Tax=Branchiostoma belcheri TaxID=7741 RepID=A0A6P5AS18_BRABE|nr:PREDICTED: calsequestrin-2-like isoform X1 [Branchiostoma belcheri]